MPKVKLEVLDWAEPGSMPERWYFYCPGCMAHYVGKGMPADEAKQHAIHCLNVKDVHRFNQNPESPTFEPSLMFDFVPGYRCHSYVRNGQIEFLTDCTHKLAGQTVPLPEIE